MWSSVDVTPCHEAGRAGSLVVGGSVVEVEVEVEVEVVVEVSGGALVVVEVVVEAVIVDEVVLVGPGLEPPPQPAATSATANSAWSHVLTNTTLRQRTRPLRAASRNQAVMPKRSSPKQSMALPRMSL